MRHVVFAVVLLASLSTFPAHAFTAFRIQDIRVEGLQRIEVGTVFNYLPVNVGEVRVVAVEERPSINKVKLTGNKDIRTEELTDALKRIGLAEGRIFDRSALEQVERELERQYFARGKYGVKITSKIEPLERNRVDVSLEID